MGAAIAAAAIGAAGAIGAASMGQQRGGAYVAPQPIDAQADQRKALSGNLGSEDQIEQLLGRANSFSQQQANDLAEQAMPGYAAVAGKFMKQANGLLTNPYSLPDDVKNDLIRQAGERGINTGVRGQAGDFSLLRDFGVNELQYGQSRISQAQSVLQTVASTAPRVNPLSPMSLYVTPQAQMQADETNSSNAQGAQQSFSNSQAAASNANASMWGSTVAKVGGIASGYVAGLSGTPTTPVTGAANAATLKTG